MIMTFIKACKRHLAACNLYFHAKFYDTFCVLSVTGLKTFLANGNTTISGIATTVSSTDAIFGP